MKTSNILFEKKITNKLLSLKNDLFNEDFQNNKEFIKKEINKSKFLIIGGAGAIGRSVTKDIFLLDPKLLHVVDINENSLTELVRDIRSSKGYIKGEFKTFVLDVSSDYFHSFLKNNNYNYVLNFSALKHVRSERDPYTLLRLIDVNIISSLNIARNLNKKSLKKYFCVSTDKATKPVNMMGASKLLMENFLMRKKIKVSFARFANVIFSDGSLFYGILHRINKNQPISCPINIKRYFINSSDASKLCLMATFLGKKNEIFIPKVKKLKPIVLTTLVKKILKLLSYQPYICKSENMARNIPIKSIKSKKWPCYFFKSDTSGEKLKEEFYSRSDKIFNNKFNAIAVLNTNYVNHIDEKLFLNTIKKIKKKPTKRQIVNLFKKSIYNFSHNEKNKNLDEKM